MLKYNSILTRKNIFSFIIILFMVSGTTTEVGQADQDQGHVRMKEVPYHLHIYLVQMW